MGEVHSSWPSVQPNMILLVIASLLSCQVMGELELAMDSSSEPGSHRSLVKRLVGGGPALVEEFPWLVSIQLNGKFHCGGSIVSASAVLTAAHCLYDGSSARELPANSFSVRAGSSEYDSGGSEHRVLLTVPHEQFDLRRPARDRVDLGLVHVSPSFDFSDGLRSRIALAGPGYGLASGTFARVAGWGSTVDGGLSGQQLRSAEVRVIDVAECSRDYGDEKLAQVLNVPDNVCTIGLDEAACNGDSGGPLTVDDYLVGVVSFSRKCSGRGPTVYVKVANFRGWIETNLNGMKEYYEHESSVRDTVVRMLIGVVERL